MILYNRVDSTPNHLKTVSNPRGAAAKGGFEGANSFASTLKASFAASDTEEDTTIDATTTDPAADASASTGADTAAPSGEHTDYVLAPDGETRLRVHDWKTDSTDYVEVLRNAESNEAFVTFAQWRVNQAAAQGVDISGSGSEPSNTELYNEWYATHDRQPHAFVYNGKEGYGYYGMDSDGHWGYYYDKELTEKIPDGNWPSYKASDGGRALFNTDNGYLWPSSARDESRAGTTVTLVAGAKAFEVEYDDLGYVKSILNLTKARGVDGRTLDLPMARSEDDRGVGGQELLRASNGVDYTGPGSGLESMEIRGADHRDWEKVMEQRGRAAVSAAEQEQTEQAAKAVEPAQTSVETAQTVQEPTQVSAEAAQTATETTQVPDVTEQTAAEAAPAPVDTARSPIGAAEREAPALTAEQVNEAIRLGNLTPDVLAAYEYLFGMPYEDEERA